MQPAYNHNRQQIDGLQHFLGSQAPRTGLTQPQALIIEPEPKSAEEMEMIFHFLGFDVSTVNDPGQMNKLLARDLIPATICIAPGLGAEKQEQWVKIIADNAPQLKPIVVTDGNAPKSRNSRNLYPDSWLRVGYPVDYRSLNDALVKAQSYRDEYDTKSQQDSQMFRSLVGKSPAIGRIRRAIEQAAPTDANVLILGESGTGKEVVARNIHLHSKRRNKPFVPVNCGAIPHDLLESELFGHEKGAFTGAISSRQGRFSMAEGGTLFLDEIGDMPMDMQVKLLRVLEERSYERVGSNQTINANVRIVAATNCNLEQLVANGKFREDLFFRLEVFPIDISPLRERIEDLPLLINHLSDRLEQKQQPSVRFSREAIMMMAQYQWPGNVRELANVIERLAIQHPYGLVQPTDLPRKLVIDQPAPELNQMQMNLRLVEDSITDIEPAAKLEAPRLPDTGMDLKAYIAEVEINLINQALDDSDGVIAHAADLLGLRRTTLTEKMRKYGINREKN